MGRKAHYVPGNNWVTCDRCGFTYRRSEIVTEWTGLAVCREYCWEPRHPQDFVRSDAENTKAPDPVRPDPDLVEGITNIGDNNITLTVGTSTVSQTFDDPLTANRTVTLSTTGATSGDQFNISKIRTDPFSVDIDGIFTIPKFSGAAVTVEFNGSSWEVERSTII